MTTNTQDPIKLALDCEIAARPLTRPLKDYHEGPGSGPLHYTWTDKPHRLVYDLAAAVKYFAEQLQALQPAAAQPSDLNLKCKSTQKRLATLWGFVPAAAQPLKLGRPCDEVKNKT